MRHKSYNIEKSGPAKRKHLYVFFVLALIFLLVGSLWLLLPKKASDITTSSNSVNPTYTSVRGNYLFSGTIMLGRAVEKSANGNYNQPFSGVDTLGTYDARIGVLECPVTNNNVSYQTQVNSLIFNCTPGWLPTLKTFENSERQAPPLRSLW